MPSPFIFLAIVAIFSLVACGGGSTSQEEDNPDDLNVLCTNNTTVEVNGIEQQMSVLDRNGDGCLSEDEYSVAEQVAESLYETQAKQLTVDGSNSSDTTSTIKSMKVSGNSEVSDGKAQLHPNLESGTFYIFLETYSNASPSESLRIYFDDESASGKNGEEPPFSMSFPLLDTSGNLTYGVTCKYSTSFSITCSNILVTSGEIVGGSVYYTLDVFTSLPLSLTFSEESLPQGGYIIGTFCEDGDNETDATCLENYAEVPVSFN